MKFVVVLNVKTLKPSLCQCYALLSLFEDYLCVKEYSPVLIVPFPWLLDTLYATAVGAEADEEITISTGVIFKFPNELVDLLDSYDTATGTHPFKFGTLVDIFTV